MTENKPFVRRIDWVNTAFLTLTPLIAFIGTGALAYNGTIHWASIVLAVVWAIFTGLGITAGYHRLFSHLAYKATWPYRLFMLCFGAAAFENSALRWCSDHRTHHRFVDTEKDPYNIKQGFFHAHMGWVMTKGNPANRCDNVPDLKQDPLVVFQDRHYIKLGIFFGFILPTAIAAMWGDALGGFFIAGFLRTVMNHHFTFSINSFAHLVGRQPYSDQDSSRDSWILALFTYGEGYHNYHHSFPSDYRNGIRFFHWDPTKWVIKGLERFGMTYGLRQVPSDLIIRARLKMDEKRVLSRIGRADSRRVITDEAIAAARARLEEAYVQFRSLRIQVRRNQDHRIAAMNQKVDAMRADLAHARARLQEAASHWGELCTRFGVRPTRVSFA